MLYARRTFRAKSCYTVSFCSSPSHAASRRAVGNPGRQGHVCWTALPAQRLGGANAGIDFGASRGKTRPPLPPTAFVTSGERVRCAHDHVQTSSRPRGWMGRIRFISSWETCGQHNSRRHHRRATAKKKQKRRLDSWLRRDKGGGRRGARARTWRIPGGNRMGSCVVGRERPCSATHDPNGNGNATAAAPDEDEASLRAHAVHSQQAFCSPTGLATRPPNLHSNRSCGWRNLVASARRIAANRRSNQRLKRRNPVDPSEAISAAPCCGTPENAP